MTRQVSDGLITPISSRLFGGSTLLIGTEALKYNRDGEYQASVIRGHSTAPRRDIIDPLEAQFNPYDFARYSDPRSTRAGERREGNDKPPRQASKTLQRRAT